jgi:hypothetical protein
VIPKVSSKRKRSGRLTTFPNGIRTAVFADFIVNVLTTCRANECGSLRFGWWIGILLSSEFISRIREVHLPRRRDRHRWALLEGRFGNADRNPHAAIPTKGPLGIKARAARRTEVTQCHEDWPSNLTIVLLVLGLELPESIMPLEQQFQNVLLQAVTPEGYTEADVLRLI